MNKFLEDVKGAFKIGDNKPKNFDVIFSEGKLGMTLSAGPDGRAIVTEVQSGGTAAKNDVQVGDIILTIDGTRAPLFKELLAVLSALGRPLQIGFDRPGGKGSSAVDTPEGKPDASNALGPLQRAQEAARRKFQELQKPKAHQPPPMTEEEKADRREAVLKAAEARTKNWDKRLQKGRQATNAKSPNEAMKNRFEASTNAETRRVVELAKQSEAATAERMGYNPYEARLMGHTAARAAVQGGSGAEGGAGVPLGNAPHQSPLASMGNLAPPSSAASTGGGGEGEGEGGGQGAGGEEEEEWVGESAVMAEGIGAEVEEALGGVLAQEHGVALVAVQTMRKMLQNMATKSGEDKFKRVRLGNPSFQGKVGSVDGGIEVMVAAGFVLQTNTGEACLQYGPCDPMPLRLRVAIEKLEQAEQLLGNPEGAQGV